MRASIAIALAAVAGSVQALPQAAPSSSSSSTISLPTSFATPSFSVSNTFTPVTTFATPEDTKPTTIFGTGPNGSPYSFSYNVPATAVPVVSKPDLESTLAAQGYPVTQQPLSPPTQNLQVNKGGSLLGRNMAPVFSFGGFVAAAVGAGAAMLLM
ncbi:hypothetical protein OC834_001153 [Tilletia horrida]|uniref:Uncharacterized protein n=1 Tax=Tilletia horrida TaxID=155126 RepID=A0AAN6G788_9BASI|nr:hypothetical protein OC842_005807 [Tilletia horrida]KAK0524767.1 hypothetical protein OC835_005818 [Tilletia horrida]KAK0536542.1 hypothetical protein OC834_001153 [Tilletia horrida]KAK0561347.1 hypothetical protein OC844_003259 [Tilletia horrida]